MAAVLSPVFTPRIEPRHVYASFHRILRDSELHPMVRTLSLSPESAKALQAVVHILASRSCHEVSVGLLKHFRYVEDIRQVSYNT